tara:strand:- start:924 stop:1544 length:621 start_codon:yes stop_codon:yes gene_type:complete
MRRFLNLNGVLIILMLLGCGDSTQDKGQTYESSEVSSRTAPVGQVCVEGDPCADGVVLASASTSVATPASGSSKVGLSEGSEHEVRMLNNSASGMMVFDPPVLKVSPGDTIHFKATDLGHNSASVAEMMPDGASSWSGGMNQDISVTLDAEGVYVYQCDPHVMMAMVGVVQVGEATNLERVKAEAAKKKSSFFSNQSRLDDYLSQL